MTCVYLMENFKLLIFSLYINKYVSKSLLLFGVSISLILINCLLTNKLKLLSVLISEGVVEICLNIY